MNRTDRPRAMLRPLDFVGLACAVAWILGLTLSAPCEAGAQALSLDETESMVRVTYFEGMPEEEAAKIGPEGCARLVEMLADPREAAHHGQIMIALGICAPAGGFEALRAWADQPRVGGIDRATFRGFQALPFALGHLAEHDRRAITRLEGQMNSSSAPNWTFRHHRGARLVRQAHRDAAMGLAISGLPEAQEILGRAEQASSDPSLREYLEGAREVHQERADRRARRAAERREGERR